MKIPTRPRQHGIHFNITPLIDVVLLLIIFFLAASHLARSESLETVDLPEADQAQDDDEQLPRRLVITVTNEHGMSFGGRSVTLEQIESMILADRLGGAAGSFEVRIRSDKQVPYKEIEPILIACARSGVTQVGFAVLPKKAASGRE